MVFRFAAAVSENANLYAAIADVVSSCKHGLQGRMPDFCQLLITSSHARNVAHAPRCLMDKLIRKIGTSSAAPPVIVGGVVQSVSGPGHAVATDTAVALLAASLPGVELMPFHVDKPALPKLEGNQWTRLLQQSKQHELPNAQSSSKSNITSSSSSSALDSAATTILLSSPHFTEVESFLHRLSNVLPGMPVMGGVTAPDAWLDTEHSFGALFCDRDMYCTGAVGCILKGPLAVQQLLVPGCRPVSDDVMTVTEASGNIILSLDGQPVHNSHLVSLVSGTEHDWKLQLGIAEPSQAIWTANSPPHSLVARNMSWLAVDGRPVLRVATAEVPVGSRVQLLVQDFNTSLQQQKQQLSSLMQSLPAAALEDPSQLGLLGYSCVAQPHHETDIMGGLLPEVPFIGAHMQGEFAGAAASAGPQPEEAAPAAAAASAQMHSFAASYGLICHRDLLHP